MSGDNEGGRSLGGGPSEPLPSAWTRSSTSSAPRVGRIGNWTGSESSSRGNSHGGGRLATLGDIASSGQPTLPGGGGMGRGDDDDDDDDDGDDRVEGESWFAGGERSGISVQNPDRPGRSIPGGNIVRDLLRRAADAGPAPASAPGQASARHGTFGGSGNTLGSEDVESEFIPDPNAPPRAPDGEEEEPTAIRHLTFWREGFSIEDGELMRYDDPANDQILEEINAGRAPPHILNVLPGQPVELRVAKRVTENYTPPPKRALAAFSGSGNRLGSPVPGHTSEEQTESMPGAFSTGDGSGGGAASGEVREAAGFKFEVDQSLPTTSVQIRLADGTRMVCRMNLTHTVLDLRNFINASRPENLTRPYSIGTTFPNRTLDDNSATIKDAGLVNSVIVQRWV